MSTRPKRDPRQEKIAAARARFCAERRSDDRLSRWMTWLRLRAAIEDWDGDELFAALSLLTEAESWRRGFRPPASFREAAKRAHSRRRRGELHFRGMP